MLTWLCLALVPVSMGIGALLTWAVLRVSRRVGALDSTGVAGQVKADRPRVPNTGGIAIVAAWSLPIIVGVAAALIVGDEGLGRIIPAYAVHHLDLSARLGDLGVLLGGALMLHALGIVDDRRALGPIAKLPVMLIVALGVPLLSPETRLLVLMDPLAGGSWFSVTVTAVWILVIVNAINYLDNMDGIAGGVCVSCGVCLMVSALLGQPQWFVAATLALLVGSVGGFLVFNAPPARIYMGDSGSLVIGFVLAYLSVRTTYYEAQSGWYAVLVPVVVLAIPVYDIVAVTGLRMYQGRSPFVGDLQHFSHRLRDRGLSDRAVMVVVAALTAITGISGVTLAFLPPAPALLVGLQCLLTLGVLGVLELRVPAPGAGGRGDTWP